MTLPHVTTGLQWSHEENGWTKWKEWNGMEGLSLWGRRYPRMEALNGMEWTRSAQWNGMDGMKERMEWMEWNGMRLECQHRHLRAGQEPTIRDNGDQLVHGFDR